MNCKISSTIAFLLIFLTYSASSQYEFSLEQTIECTEIKSQDRTGTCWSFATSSMLESEAIRLNQMDVDLSEMYIVRHVYFDKARNYILRQGNANFSEGSLSHDVTSVMSKYGIVPEAIYPGRVANAPHDHSEMVRVLKGTLDALLKKKPISDKWHQVVNGILDAYLGKVPEQFEYQGMQYSPMEFADALGVGKEEYISLTSFSHHPFYEKFILEIPDNYSNGKFYNVPLDDLIETIDGALKKGYTVAWDGDVSESSFNARKGIAVLPVDAKRDDVFTNPVEEIDVDQDNRQEAFESFKTTDDHLMHITGISHDQDGNRYYLIKNSWGEIGPEDGYLHMSEAYLRMKTVGVMVNRSAVPAKISSKINM